MREENKKSEERKRGKDMQPAPPSRKVGCNGEKVSINLKHFSTNSMFSGKRGSAEGGGEGRA